MNSHIRTLVPALLGVLVGASCSATSDNTFDDLRREAAQRQASYPAPPAPADRTQWPSLTADAGPSLNGGQGGASGSMVPGSTDAGHEGGTTSGDAGGPDANSSVGTALYNNVTYYPSGSGNVVPSQEDGTASVTHKGGTLVISPGTPVSLSLDYTSSAGTIDAFGVQFGDSAPIERVDDDLTGSHSGAAAIQLTADASVCDGLAPGCYELTTNVFALTPGNLGGEQASAPVAIDTVLLCGVCQDNGCGTLNPKCGDVTPGDASASVGCGNSVQGTSVDSGSTVVQMNTTSGSPTLTYNVLNGSAQFQVRSGGVLVDTGCVTASGSKSFSYGPGLSSQLSVSVTPNCSIVSDSGLWVFNLACVALQ